MRKLSWANRPISACSAKCLHDGKPIAGNLVLDTFKTDCKKAYRNVNKAEVELFAQSVPRRKEPDNPNFNDVGRTGRAKLRFYKLASLPEVRMWFDKHENWDDREAWASKDDKGAFDGPIG